MPVENQNQLASVGSQANDIGGPTLVSSANGTAVTHGIHHVSGTAALATLGVPYAGFKGTVILIPDAAFTTVTGGTVSGLQQPIGIATTAVVGKALSLTFDGKLWYNSY